MDIILRISESLAIVIQKKKPDVYSVIGWFVYLSSDVMAGLDPAIHENSVTSM
jgi:hypothetical protein